MIFILFYFLFIFIILNARFVLSQQINLSFNPLRVWSLLYNSAFLRSRADSLRFFRMWF